MYGLIGLADMVEDAFLAEGFDSVYEVAGHRAYPGSRWFVGRKESGRAAIVWFTPREERVHATAEFVAMKVAAAIHGRTEVAA